MERSYTVVLLSEAGGGFSVSVPALRGCHTQGETVPEALERAREAIRGFIKSLRKHGEPIPEDLEEFPFGLGEALGAHVYRVTVFLQEAAPLA